MRFVPIIRSWQLAAAVILALQAGIASSEETVDLPPVEPTEERTLQPTPVPANANLAGSGWTGEPPRQVWEVEGMPEYVSGAPASAADFIPPTTRTVDGYTYPNFLADATPDFLWYVVFDALPLRRDVDDEFAFQGLGSSSEIVLDSRDLDSDFEMGGRLIVGRGLSPRFSIEASYTGLSDWTDQSFVRDTSTNGLGGAGNLMSPFTGFGDPPAAGVDYNNFAQIGYTSNYDNIELNIRQKMVMPEGPYEIYLLYGLRYAKVKENFYYRTESSTGAGSVNDVSVGASNNLFAIQIGSLVQIRTHDFWGIELDVKGALAQNDASQRTRYFNNTGGVETLAFTGRDETRTSLMGDISLTANYTVTPQFSLRFGYHATVITGVALGANNFETDLNALTLGPGRLDHDGEILYHGPNIGGVCRW